MSAQQKKHAFDFNDQYGLGFSTHDDEIVVDFFRVEAALRPHSVVDIAERVLQPDFCPS